MARILVIDDERDIVDVLTFFLGDLGHDVVTACDPGTGLEVARTARPDLIICDVMMPEMSGYQVCSRLKADPHTTSTPVVLVSAADVARERMVADAALRKPFDFDVLETTLNSLLGAADNRRSRTQSIAS